MISNISLKFFNEFLCMSVVLIVFLNYSNINPSVLFFNNSFFIKAFLEKKKEKKKKTVS